MDRTTFLFTNGYTSNPMKQNTNHYFYSNNNNHFEKQYLENNRKFLFTSMKIFKI